MFILLLPAALLSAAGFGVVRAVEVVEGAIRHLPFGRR